MLPATLVTLATFLLEFCNSSPVYNMQPAFITNSIGATAGRNIRNLPCISRKKNNQSGVCMFAIDCMKANGTHLGTCIDRFYFGSCCHIEPIRDIIDNSIDTDILPHRQPPFRVSSTTPRTESTTLRTNERTTITSSTKMDTSTISSTAKTTAIPIIISSAKPKPTPKPVTVAFGQRVTTTKAPSTAMPTTMVVETSTTLQKLQTFQVVDGDIVEQSTTKSPTIATTKAPPNSSPRPVVSKPVQNEPPSLPSTSSPKPVSAKPSSTKPPGKPTASSVTKTTVRPRPTKPASTTAPPTKSPPKKPTRKPSGTTTKPSRPLSTTKKPQVSTTSKITRKPTTTSPKPTKGPTTTKQTTPKSTTVSKIATKKPATTQSNTTVKVTKGTTTTTSRPTTQSSTVSSTSKTTTKTTTETFSEPPPLKKEPSGTTVLPILTTTAFNEVPSTQMNATTLLETVNGNLATNEIEEAKPVVPMTDGATDKPGLVTWTLADEINKTASTSLPEVNITDWVPITPPDGWVLLPSVSNSPQNENVTQPPSPTTSSTTITPSSAATPPSSPPAEVEGTSNAPLVTEEQPFVTFLSIETTTAPSNSSTAASFPEVTDAVTVSLASESSTTGPTSEGMMSSTEMPETSVNMSDYRDVCGRRMFPEARIVGGEKSPFGKWPWQISLRQWRTSTYLHKCGAALLNENWAITAAHCVDNVPPSDLLLRLGEHDLSTESEPYLHQERRVQIVASHPQFDPRTFEYDLALLRFYEPVTFQPNILPVCVPQSDENFVGRTAYVTGWGRLYEDGPLPSILQEVSVPVINNTVCETMYRAAGYIEHIPHIFICAGWRRGGFDSCEGDSGGPMVIQRDDKRFLLAGVISWGIGCAEPNQPGVYTRISEFREWINQILQF